MELSIRHARICLYEVALHIHLPPDGNDSTMHNRNVISQTTRHSNLLIRLLEKAKAYFDVSLSVPTEHYERLTTLHRCQFPHIAVVMLKLAFNTTNGTPQDPFPLRKACDLSYYMERHANPCKDHNPAHCDEQCASRDILSHHRDKIRRIKTWYDRLETLGDIGAEDSLKDMSSLNLEKIEVAEEEMFQMDWTKFDISSFDLSQIWD